MKTSRKRQDKNRWQCSTAFFSCLWSFFSFFSSKSDKFSGKCRRPRLLSKLKTDCDYTWHEFCQCSCTVLLQILSQIQWNSTFFSLFLFIIPLVFRDFCFFIFRSVFLCFSPLKRLFCVISRNFKFVLLVCSGWGQYNKISWDQ